MCNYCGCRALEAVAALTAEHEQILNLSGDIRRAVGSGAHGAAAGLLCRLQTVLELHDAIEELALYPALARFPEFAEKVGTLFDEHDEVDRVIRAVLTGKDNADWDAVLTALQTLAAHMDHEEHGVFPAAAVNLDPADWEHATAVRDAHEDPGLGRRDV